jgi:uncharacterized protein YacL
MYAFKLIIILGFTAFGAYIFTAIINTSSNNKTKNINTEDIFRAKTRLLIGAMLGTIIVWVLLWSFAYSKDSMNIFVILSMPPVGVVGATMGAIIGLISKKWSKNKKQ